MEESHFARVFLSWFQKHTDPDAREMPDVIDRPDMGIETDGKRIAVELAQMPSSYIIQQLHRRMPEPVYAQGAVSGHLVVYPFEPHRWVHDVIGSKAGKSESYRSAIQAQEVWLVLHSPSINDDWPMSEPSKHRTRQAESLLMRFGLKAHPRSFRRVFFIYADGAVIELTGEPVPMAISLPKDSGYPALTARQFSFSFDVPLPGLGFRKYQFHKISFDKIVIAPKDEWMAHTFPQVEEPLFTIRASVSSESAEWEILRDGISIFRQSIDVSAQAGQTQYIHFLLNWSIQMTTFEVRF